MITEKQHDSLKKAKQYFLEKGCVFSKKGDWNRQWFKRGDGTQVGYAWKNKFEGHYETVEFGA
jgi:hypothetical protein